MDQSKARKEALQFALAVHQNGTLTASGFIKLAREIVQFIELNDPVVDAAGVDASNVVDIFTGEDIFKKEPAVPAELVETKTGYTAELVDVTLERNGDFSGASVWACGFIHNDSNNRWEDGSSIRTSAIHKIVKYGPSDDVLIVTRNNSYLVRNGLHLLEVYNGER